MTATDTSVVDIISAHHHNRLELKCAIRLLLKSIDADPCAKAYFNPEHIEYARLVVDSLPEGPPLVRSPR